MPFCRKCGRRLVEYSEVCTDCGQSTTAPMINTKRIQPSQTTGKLDKKIAKAIIPDMVPVQIKVIVDKPAKVKVAPKAVASPVQAIAVPKAAAPVKIVAPIRVAPARAVEPPKPVLSSKHIVKTQESHTNQAVGTIHDCIRQTSSRLRGSSTKSSCTQTGHPAQTNRS